MSPEDSCKLEAADGSLVDIPPAFVCPITGTIMEHPLFTREGFNFERHAILAWIAENGTCPLTRKPMAPSNLVPNRALETKIRFFLRNHGLSKVTDQDSDQVKEKSFSAGLWFVSALSDSQEEVLHQRSQTVSSRAGSGTSKRKATRTLIHV